MKKARKNDDKKSIGTLEDTDLCFEAFTDFIFQCSNGHLACSLCSKKLSKCPNCSLQIGKIRCRSMEKIVESITFLCPNSIFGCPMILPYKDKNTHEQKCMFSQCTCPLQECKYIGNYKDLYHHFDSTHIGYGNGYRRYDCGTTIDVWMLRSDKIYVLKETKECLLYVVQCFKEENGVYVTVSCVAPLGVELDKFSYHLSVSSQYTITFESPKIKRIQEVKFERPEENFMFIPRFFNGPLEMKVLIRKLNTK